MHISLLSPGFLLLIPVANAQLNLWARSAGKLYFGTATDNYELADAPYAAQTKNILDFAQITPVSEVIISYSLY